MVRRENYRLYRMVIVGFGIIFAVLCILYSRGRLDTTCSLVEDEKGLAIEIKISDGEEKVYLTDAGDNGYIFFLPAYVTNNELYLDLFEGTIFDEYGEWSGYSLYEWEENRPCTVVTSNGDVYDIKFMGLDNLPTIYMETSSGSLQYLLDDKSREETGSLSIITSKGVYEKEDEELVRVSGRGNTTFGSPQPGLGFVMEQGAAICGLDYGKKWNLVSLYYSPDLLKTKIVYDMALRVGLQTTSDSTWVDLYCNGIYMGVYLLAEPVDVSPTCVNINDLEKQNEKVNYDLDLDLVDRKEDDGIGYYAVKSPDDISGGYIIQLTPDGRIQEEESYFNLEKSNFIFTLKSPDVASKEEVQYIKDYVQMIDDKIYNNDQTYWDYIDKDSFSKQLLIDLIACEQDAMWDSSFYYKDMNSDLLKAGPLWDYDRSFGITQDHIDYTKSIEQCVGDMEEWYLPFYSNHEFRNMMIDDYVALLPYIEELVDSGIGEYTSYLSASQRATEVLVTGKKSGYHAYSYNEYANTIRYLKYNMVNRCNFLTEQWELGDEYLLKLPENQDVYHTVIIRDEEKNVIKEIQVKDGECITGMPMYDEDIYVGFRMNAPWLIYNGMLPIYEDTKLTLERKPKSY